MQKKPYNQGFSLLIHTKLSRLLPAKIHTQRFGLALSFRRFPYSFYESYTPGHLLDLRSHLVAWEIIYFYFADASARTSSDTASTWCVCGTQKVWGNLLRISSVLPTSLHIRRDVFVETSQPAGLSSTRTPTLGRV